ncbi:MAG TPA: DUF1997 domain-containing protein [Allocoleopsis sp.]
MQTKVMANIEKDAFDVPEAVFTSEGYVTPEDHIIPNDVKPMCFKSHFTDYMIMRADKQIVAEYFANHQDWFPRCAQPMKAEALGANAYILTIGRFGSFGYEVEPKIGLELQPPVNDIYITTTVPVPDYVPPGYDVDYFAQMELTASEENGLLVTRVEWTLDLTVYMKFPKFILKLSKSLLQTTGDRILNQIIIQVSKRLTQKVLNDFHTTLGIVPPTPQKKRFF